MNPTPPPDTNGYSLDRDYLRTQLDRLWTTLEGIGTKVARIETLVSNDHEHRLSNIEVWVRWGIVSIIAGLASLVWWALTHLDFRMIAN